MALPNAFGLCPDGWTLFEGHCYVWFPWLQTDFFKASEMCHSVNSHILTIDSEREQKFITNYYSHVQNNIWVDDENSKYDDYFSEDDTTVSDDDNSQNCSVVHFLNKSKTKWVKSNCQYFNNVVCKARQQNLVDLLENFLKGIDEDVCQRIAQISRMSGKHRFPRHYLSHLTTKECEEGWYKFDEKCYKIVKENGVQAEAEAKCQEMGAHLASIHSKEENDFLIDLGNQKKSFVNVKAFNNLNLLNRKEIWQALYVDWCCVNH